MKWKQPPSIKIYEALGAVADGRVETTETSAKVFSSSRKKFYAVQYHSDNHSIMANDNGSYWRGYLGYPAIAFLLATGELEYKENLANLLKGIAWKDLNQRFNNDFDQTLAHIQSSLPGTEREELLNYVSTLEKQIIALNLTALGKKMLPPEGY